MREGGRAGSVLQCTAALPYCFNQESPSRDSVKGERTLGKKGVKVGRPINGPQLTFVKSFPSLTVMLAIIGMAVIRATLSLPAEMIPLRRWALFSDHITPVMESAF